MTRVAATLRRWVRVLLIVVARDVTKGATCRSALVVAPHPDDETLGCGARIARARSAGTDVVVVVLGDGSGSHVGVPADPATLVLRRKREAYSASAMLGVGREHVKWLGYPDDSLDQRVQAIADDLEVVLRLHRPEEVLVTCAQEHHRDHAAASRAVSLAVERLDFDVRTLEYPIWLWADWPVSRRHSFAVGLRQILMIVARRSVETVRIEGFREIKRGALSCYTSQLGVQRLPSRLDKYQPAPGAVALPKEILARALSRNELFFRVGQRPSARRSMPKRSEAVPRRSQ